MHNKLKHVLYINKMSKAKILWVQDEYEGPMNGLAEYNGEKLWFSRMSNPLIISSTEVPVPYVNSELEKNEIDNLADRLYMLYRLSSSDMVSVVMNHVEHCEKTGAPLNHGDPVKIKRKTKATKMPTEVIQSIIPQGKEEIELEVERRSMAAVKQYQHSVVPSSITGEHVATIKQSEFSNYLVPRTCVMDDF